jgi:hypothetical protein
MVGSFLVENVKKCSPKSLYLTRFSLQRYYFGIDFRMKVSLRASLRTPTMARPKHELGREFTTVFYLESYHEQAAKVRPSVCSSGLSLVFNPWTIPGSGPHWYTLS